MFYFIGVTAREKEELPLLLVQVDLESVAYVSYFVFLESHGATSTINGLSKFWQ